MKRLFLIAGCLLTAGCATQKVTLRDLQEYDQAIKLAESQNMDTHKMHEHLVDMMLSYSTNPGEDAYAKAAKEASNAMQWNAAAAVFEATKPQPTYQPMPPPPPLMPGYTYGR
jgi:hypothetical protein